GSAGVSIVARDGGGLESAGGAAAAPRLAVGRAQVALLARVVDDAVPAYPGDLADDDAEGVGPDPAGGQTRTLDLKEVGATRAPGDGLRSGGIADRSRRWGCDSIREAEEGADVARERALEHLRNPTDVPREVDDARNRCRGA